MFIHKPWSKFEVEECASEDDFPDFMYISAPVKKEIATVNPPTKYSSYVSKIASLSSSWARPNPPKPPVAVKLYNLPNVDISESLASNLADISHGSGPKTENSSECIVPIVSLSSRACSCTAIHDPPANCSSDLIPSNVAFFCKDSVVDDRYSFLLRDDSFKVSPTLLERHPTYNGSNSDLSVDVSSGTIDFAIPSDVSYIVQEKMTMMTTTTMAATTTKKSGIKSRCSNWIRNIGNKAPKIRRGL